MKILYISTALTADEFNYLNKLKKTNILKGGMQESSNKFHGLIIHGLAENDCEITALSGLNVSTKTHKKIVFKQKQETISDKIIFLYPLTLNVKFLKQIVNSITFFILTLKWLLKNKNTEKCIIIDAAYVSILPFVNLATKIVKTNKIAIVADIYNYMADVAETTNIKQKIVKKIVKSSYKQINGFVFLTKEMNNVINHLNAPFIVMEGLVNNKIPNHKIKKSDKYVIMYAGALRKKFGVENLISNYIKYDNDQSELWIFGDGDYKEELLLKIKSDDRIKFFGAVSNELIVKKEMEATLLINPRGCEEEFTKYSFPSKNMEYLLSGTPMIGYKLPGIPDEYDDYINYIPKDELGILKTIIKMFNFSKQELNYNGKQAQKFVVENKNNILQAGRIIDLIKRLGMKK